MLPPLALPPSPPLALPPLALPNGDPPMIPPLLLPPFPPTPPAPPAPPIPPFPAYWLANACVVQTVVRAVTVRIAATAEAKSNVVLLFKFRRELFRITRLINDSIDNFASLFCKRISMQSRTIIIFYLSFTDKIITSLVDIKNTEFRIYIKTWHELFYDIEYLYRTSIKIENLGIFYWNEISLYINDFAYYPMYCYN